MISWIKGLFETEERGFISPVYIKSLNIHLIAESGLQHNNKLLEQSIIEEGLYILK